MNLLIVAVALWSRSGEPSSIPYPCVMNFKPTDYMVGVAGGAEMPKIFVEVAISVVAFAGIASWVCSGSWVRYDSPATMAKALVWVL